MDVAVGASSKFHMHQLKPLYKTVHCVWRQKQQEHLGDKKLVIGGDGRHSTVGHSAMYCTYSGQSRASCKIVSVEQVHESLLFVVHFLLLYSCTNELLLWLFDIICYPFVEERDRSEECDDWASGFESANETPSWAEYLHPHVDHSCAKKWMWENCKAVWHDLWPMVCNEGLKEDDALAASWKGELAVAQVVIGNNQSPLPLCTVQRQTTAARGKMVVYWAPHYGWSVLKRGKDYVEI